jgi:hypothetical protein
LQHAFDTNLLRPILSCAIIFMLILRFQRNQTSFVAPLAGTKGCGLYSASLEGAVVTGAIGMA